MAYPPEISWLQAQIWDHHQNLHYNDSPFQIALCYKFISILQNYLRTFENNCLLLLQNHTLAERDLSNLPCMFLCVDLFKTPSPLEMAHQPGISWFQARFGNLSYSECTILDTHSRIPIGCNDKYVHISCIRVHRTSNANLIWSCSS